MRNFGSGVKRGKQGEEEMAEKKAELDEEFRLLS